MSTTGVFRREPGDWPCSQCNEVNFKSRTACRRCSTPRSQPVANNSSPAGATSQIVSKPGDWTCHSCNNINFAARIACHKCGRQKQNTTASNIKATPVQKPGDWTCSSCTEMNFGSRTVCRSCGTARPSAEGNNSNNNNNTSECVICMERGIDSVITTCGHSAVCLQCGNQIGQCPICRNPFTQQQIIKLFNVH